MTLPRSVAAEWEATLEARARMHAGGWRVVPVCEARKCPLFAGWPAYEYDPAAPEPPVPYTFSRDGAPTRAPHLGTGAITVDIVALDIDIDDVERSARARAAFELAAEERSPVVRFRAGCGRRLLVFGAAPEQAGCSLSAGDDVRGKIELFAAHPGRQVFLLGRHPSGASLEYEGDSPPDWAVSELPVLEEARMKRAYLAALEAVQIPVPDFRGHSGPSVRRQRDVDSAVIALAEETRRIFTGESVHRASNSAADLMAFQLGFDGDQIGHVLRALALTAAALNPVDAHRYDELVDKSGSRGAWYAEAAMRAPADAHGWRYWRAARERQFRRAWDALPADLRAEFLGAAARVGALPHG